MNSQTQSILKHMQEVGSITPLEALNKYGCFRLASRINDIKNLGHEVQGKMITNGVKRYKEYWIEK